MENLRLRFGKSAIMLLILYAVVGLMIVTPPRAFSQTAPNIQGTWDIQVTCIDVGWDGKNYPFAEKAVAHFYQEEFSSPDQPNLLMKIPGELDLDGFVQGDRMVIYRNNDAHFPPGENTGRELIIGTILGNGENFIADDLGFDSNTEHGASWSCKIKGHKTSDDVP